jgi:hypothetical protein
MAQEHLAATALRHIIFATETGEGGIGNFNTKVLPNGALAFALDTHTEYRLHKDLTGGTNTGSQIAGSGGGLWLATQATGFGINFFVVTEIVSSAVSFDTNWAALPSGSNHWSSAGSGSFGVNLSTGVVTYNGPAPFQALVTAQVPFIDGGQGPLDFALAISLNGALIGGASYPAIFAWQAVAQNARATLVTIQYYSVIDAGDTLQPVMKVNTGAGTPTITGAQMIIQPAGA